MAKKRTGESLKDLFKKDIGSEQSRRQSVNMLKSKKVKHTIHLSPEISEKLRLYAAKHRRRLNEVVEELIDKDL